MLTIDFETRSELDLKKVGAWKYAAHPSTEVLCMSWERAEGDVVLWVPGDVTPQELRARILAGELVEAHNAMFERAVWECIMVRDGWPAIAPRQWRCSASRAAFFALPRALGDVAHVLGVADQKDKTGHRIMLQLCKPRKPTKNNPAKWVEDPEKFAALYAYNIQDVKTESAVSKKLPPLSPTELRVWQLDQTINARGIYCDIPGVRAAIALAARAQKRLNVRAMELSGGKVTSPAGEVARVREFCIGEGVPEHLLPDLTKQTVTDLLDPDGPHLAGLPLRALKMLEIRQASAKSSTKKLNAMLRAAGADGRIRDTLMYHGASTGRFTGKAIQPQNFPRGTIKDVNRCIEVIKSGDLDLLEMLYGDALEAISSCLRGFLTAAPGHELLCSDYAGIEARVLFWLADETRGVQMIERGMDLYVDMATVIYGVPAASVTTDQRRLGKYAVLGCGYNMGWEKFIVTCKVQGNFVVEAELAQKAVSAYRSKYAKVQQLWWNTEAAALLALKTRQPVRVRNAGAPVTFMVRGSFLQCRLPSGRVLSYFHPRLQMKKTPWGEMKEVVTFMGANSQTKRWERQSTYGGKLVENIVQAIARDLMVDAMLRVEPAGYPIVLTVHDEILSEVPKGFGSQEEFDAIMSAKPAWAAGCPVSVEGWRGERYRKG